MLEQLKVVWGLSDLVEVSLPTTTTVIPMAHLVFKVCWSNIYPRVGNRSNFTYHDLVVVAMILSGKAFDVADLIIKNMLVAVGNSKSNIPYALLLTKIFKFFNVICKDVDRKEVSEFLDAKSLAQLSLKVLYNGMPV